MDLRSVRLVGEIVRASGTPAILAGVAGPDRHEESDCDLTIAIISVLGPDPQHSVYSWLDAALSFGAF